jgi:hypothetical protein
MFSTKTGILLIVLLVSSINIFSQDAEEKKLGWFFEGKLAGLWAGGNSESFTIGLGATLKHIWTNSELRFDAGGLQTQSSKTTRTAVGTTEDFQVNEDKVTEKTAEKTVGVDGPAEATDAARSPVRMAGTEILLRIAQLLS